MAEDINEKKNSEDFEEKTNKLPPLNADADDGSATVIRDANETVMGSSPDMEMLVLGARFVVISGQDTGKEFLITNKDMIAGRGDDCDFRLDYKGVSRRHFKISYANGKVMLEDLESKFGTILKGNKIGGPVALCSGDMIQLGELTLKFIIGEEKKAGKPGAKLMLVAFIAVFIIGGAGMLKLMLGSKQPAEPQPPAAVSDSSQASSISGVSSTASPSEIENKIHEAQTFAQNNDYGSALAIIDKVVAMNPTHSEALALQKMWRENLSLTAKLDQARRLFEAGSLEQAQILTKQILDASPQEQEAIDLADKIKKAKESQSVKGVLEDARKLSNEGRFDAAKNLLQTIKDAAWKPQVDDLMNEIDTKIQIEVIYKDAKALFNSGDLKGSLEKVREGLRQASQHNELKQLEVKIEMVQKLQEEAEKNLNSPMPLSAREPLQKMIHECGDANPLSAKAKDSLAQLNAKSSILAHIAYQEALAQAADGNFPEAIGQLNQLVKDFPQETYFRESRDDLALRLDNLGKSLFRAGYVLEDQEPLKAKEIWLRLLNFLPKEHIYAQKIKSKMRNLGLSR